MEKRMLEGKVAVVTGAGRGIGLAVATLMAGHGAKVVVNDPGHSVAGEASQDRPADEAVEAITKAGGEAVANYDSVADVEGAGRIVQQALDSFGRIDVIVNNAGILRDRIFHKMTPEEWRAVIDVHLQRQLQCLPPRRAALPRAGKRLLRAHDLDVRAGRQCRTGELCRGQDGHRGAVAIDCARHGPFQRALQLHLALCLEPHDRLRSPTRPTSANGSRSCRR
jgi:NAD(P)-dependent dehydrogenase (short-subunit alcohol dehydrogenase family)